MGEDYVESTFERSGYRLSADEAHDLTARLLGEQPATVDDKYVCYEISGTDQFSDIGRYVEQTRFGEMFDNSPEEMEKEYGPYEMASTFFISVDQENKVPTGTLRIIRSSSSGLKTINDISGPPLSLSSDAVQQAHAIDTFENCWDVGTVAAMPGYPSGAASIQLYRASYLAAMREHVPHAVSVIDSNVLPKLTNYLGIPFVPLAGTEPFEYLGSKSSQAVYCYIPEFYEKTNRRRFTLRGLLARKALNRLVMGSEDHTLMPPRL